MHVCAVAPEFSRGNVHLNVPQIRVVFVQIDDQIAMLPAAGALGGCRRGATQRASILAINSGKLKGLVMWQDHRADAPPEMRTTPGGARE